MNDSDKLYEMIDVLMGINAEYLDEDEREKVYYSINDIVIEIEDLISKIKGN
jgi:hypothetical protein